MIFPHACPPVEWAASRQEQVGLLVAGEDLCVPCACQLHESFLFSTCDAMFPHRRLGITSFPMFLVIQVDWRKWLLVQAVAAPGGASTTGTTWLHMLAQHKHNTTGVQTLHIHTHRHTHTHIHTHTHKHTHTHTGRDTDTHTKLHTHTHIYTHARAHTHRHTHTHTQTQTHTHTYKLRSHKLCTHKLRYGNVHEYNRMHPHTHANTQDCTHIGT